MSDTIQVYEVESAGSTRQAIIGRANFNRRIASRLLDAVFKLRNELVDDDGPGHIFLSVEALVPDE